MNTWLVRGDFDFTSYEIENVWRRLKKSRSLYIKQACSGFSFFFFCLHGFLDDRSELGTTKAHCKKTNYIKRIRKKLNILHDHTSMRLLEQAFPDLPGCALWNLHGAPGPSSTLLCPALCPGDGLWWHNTGFFAHPTRLPAMFSQRRHGQIKPEEGREFRTLLLPHSSPVVLCPSWLQFPLPAPPV